MPNMRFEAVVAFDSINPSQHSLALDEVIEHVEACPQRSAPSWPFVLYSIHDGDLVPPAFAAHATSDAFARERDFGADAVAAALATALGIAARWRVRLARCVLDAGRSFGSDDGRAAHTSRLAVPATIAAHADRDSLAWLEGAHARIEATIADAVAAAGAAPIAIGVHTYDPVSPDGSPRPELSLLDLPESVARRVVGFEPRSTADSRMLDRLAAALAAESFNVRRNDPYLLPDGSLEVRLHRRAARERWSNRDRLQAFVLEIRKDLICDGRQSDGYFAASAIRIDAVHAIVQRVARALSSLARG